jgi:hypothetical protein
MGVRSALGIILKDFRTMANVKNGQLVPPPEWWKHLRWMKRNFWKSHRRAEQREVLASLSEAPPSKSRDNGET